MKDAGGGGSAIVPWLTVAIPCYNVAPYIADCIRSVAQQSATDGVEILVCDDVSTDGGKAIVQDLSRDIAALRLIEHSQNSGVGAARNTLLDAARGDYLWYLDGDDMLMPGAVEALRTVVQRHAPDLVLCDFRRSIPLRLSSFDGPKNVLRPGGAELVSGVFMTGRMHPWSKVARRSLWTGLRSPVGRWFEDVTSSANLILKAKTFYHATQSWVYYRVRSDGFVGKLNRAGTFDMANATAFVDSLSGYQQRLVTELGPPDPSVRYAVSAFCGHEFANIAKRIVGAKGAGDAGAMGEKLAHFRAAIEQNSPMDFDTLLAEHGRKLAFYKYWHLRGALNLVRRYAT